jgi:hypothetical protein
LKTILGVALRLKHISISIPEEVHIIHEVNRDPQGFLNETYWNLGYRDEFTKGLINHSKFEYYSLMEDLWTLTHSLETALGDTWNSLTDPTDYEKVRMAFAACFRDKGMVFDENTLMSFYLGNEHIRELNSKSLQLIFKATFFSLITG